MFSVRVNLCALPRNQRILDHPNTGMNLPCEDACWIIYVDHFGTVWQYFEGFYGFLTFLSVPRIPSLNKCRNLGLKHIADSYGNIKGESNDFQDLLY